jgi:acyl-coenzyme A synthetase/AMP-(fatty) acid ligase
VLLVLPDTAEFAAAYFGTKKIGAVAVPTSTVLRAADYAYFLEESQARIAIVHSTLLAEFAPAVSPLRYCKNVIVCGEPVLGYTHWNEFLRDASSELEPVPTSKDDAAFWLWTSGRPKAAVHLHRDWSTVVSTTLVASRTLEPEISRSLPRSSSTLTDSATDSYFLFTSAPQQFCTLANHRRERYFE